MHGRPMLTLTKNMSRSSQAHDSYIVEELIFLMLHTKFQNHRPSGSGEVLVGADQPLRSFLFSESQIFSPYSGANIRGYLSRGGLRSTTFVSVYQNVRIGL